MGLDASEVKNQAFEGGLIGIQLANNQASFEAGGIIQGFVNVYLSRPCFEAKQLTLELRGKESTKFHRRFGKRREKTLYGNKNIVELVFPLQDYVDGPPQQGMNSYPFTITLPEDLQPSMYLHAKYKSANLCTSYVLRAQVIPVKDKDWMDENKTISTLNGSQVIYITKPNKTKEVPQKMIPTTCGVGGFCGLRKTVAHVEVTFNKKQFYPGETASAHVVIDNATSSRDVEFVELKLCRYHVARDTNNWYQSFQTEVIKRKRAERGVAKGEKATFDLELQIPTEDVK